MDKLKCFLSANKIDIICITETHFSNDILDAEIEIEGFSFKRKDRNFNIKSDKLDDYSDGGGSIIYYKNYLNVDLVKEFTTAPDSLAISVQLSRGNICIACIYRSMSLNDKQNQTLRSCIDSICNDKVYDESLLLGDFNLPEVCWVTGSVNCNAYTDNKVLLNQIRYMELFNIKGLSWYFTNETTRRRLVKGVLQESLLDQVITTNDAILNSVEILPKLGKSDHVCVKVELGVSLRESIDTIMYKQAWGKVKSTDLSKFSSENVNWEYSSDDLTVEQMWDELHVKMQSFNAVIPTSAVYSNGRPVKLPWGTSKLNRMRIKKDKAWSAFDFEPTLVNFNYAMDREKIYDDEHIKLKIKYEKKITCDLKNNCKPFYSYLRNNREAKTCIRSLDKGDGSRTKDATESAEVLANAFSSVFVREPQGPLPEFCPHNNNEDCCIDELVITSAAVREELSKLNIFKSYGPDSVHPKLLKSLSDDNNFINAITKLFVNCATSGTIPKIWKTASVTALFKKGSKADPLNYRPVSLTCILCKVYEQFVREHIVNFIEDRISVQQHGFVKQKSCLTNLLESFDSMLNILQDGDPVDVLYFDFSKAFDTVPHYRLLSKMEAMGIKGNILDIVRDFLSDRIMYVSVEGKKSKTKIVLSGVPQGSVLGPLLFILFINDLPDNVKSTIKMFADDLKLIGNVSNHDTILEDIKQLEKWENLWLLKFNPNKCKILHIDYNHNPNMSYTVDGVELQVSENNREKDLGVFTSNSLLWNDQITSSISRANKMICWVARNVILRDRRTMLAIYKSLIRPHIEYCVQLWNPVAEFGNWNLILALEGVQRRFTRLIDEIGTLPYSQRLDILNLTTLAERRNRGDLIETFKAVSGQTCIGNMFNVSRSGLKLISNIRVSKGSSKVQNLSRGFLTNRVINFWNKLPNNVKMSSSVDNFKINLEEFKVANLQIKSGENFWDVSDEVLSRIEGNSYLERKVKHNKFLKDNPFVAKKQFVNLYSTGLYNINLV